MVRLIAAPALAFTIMAAAAPSALAAHRHQHVAHMAFGYHAHHAGHFSVRYRYAVARTRAGRYGAPAMVAADAGYSVQQDPQRGPYALAEMPTVRGSYRMAVGRRYVVREEAAGHIVYGGSRVAGGRPRAWCGWYARSLVGQDPGPAFNLARNWARWGHASGPGVGVMVVWSHHVGMITGRSPDGQWIVKSGNDGGGVARERPRSLAGAIAFRHG